MSTAKDNKSIIPTDNSHPATSQEAEIISNAERQVTEKFAKGGNDKYGRFFLSALSGIPWILPLSLVANLKSELEQDKMNQAIAVWLKEHQEKIKELMETINEILTRLDNFGDEVKKRIESPEYLVLVRRAFRTWGEAETQEKRKMIKQLLINAGAITLCPDDQVRLFIDWIERYHEAHFAVMKEVYLHQPITKGTIWDNIHPEGRPRDDSAQAGLFGYLTRELNMGGIIHLDRPVNAHGQAMRTSRPTHSQPRQGGTLESHFDDSKQWVLTALGKEFVRYVIGDVDQQLESGKATEDSNLGH